MTYSRYERDCIEDYGFIPAEPEEVDPKLIGLANTPEGRGLYRYSVDALESYISDLVAEMAFPMSESLLKTRIDELCEWMEILREVEKQRAAA